MGTKSTYHERIKEEKGRARLPPHKNCFLKKGMRVLL